MIKNIVFNQIGFIISAFIALIISPYVVHNLGDESYGIWALLTSFAGHYGLLSFGLQGSTTRQLSYHMARGEKTHVEGYFNSAFNLLLVASILVMVLGSIATILLPHIFDIADGMMRQSQICTFIISITSSVTFLVAPFHSLIISKHRFDIGNMIGVSLSIIRGVLTFIIIKNGGGIISLALLMLFITIIGGIAQFVCAKKLCPYIRCKVPFSSKYYSGKLLNYAYKSFISTVAIVLIFECDLIIIGIFLPSSQITVYSLATSLVTYVSQFISAIAFVIGPHATAIYAESGFDALRDYFKITSKVMYLVGGLVVSGMIVFSGYFYSLWMGHEYIESSFILIILAAIHFFSTGNRVGGSVLVATGKIGFMTVLVLCEGLINLVLSLVLVRQYGIQGVAFSTLIAHCIINLIFIIYMGKVLNFKEHNLFLKLITPGLVLISIFTIFGMKITNSIAPDSWLFLSIQVFLYIILYLLFSSIILKKDILMIKKIFMKRNATE